MLAYLAPILVFGLVIFVHELGHFLAAKLTGVYAPRFSIGFGPALFRRRRGETEYVLAGAAARRLRADGVAARRRGGVHRGRQRGDRRPASQATPATIPNAMIPFGPKPVPENRWFESQAAVGADLHHDRRRDDEHPPGVRRRHRPSTCTYGRAVDRHARRRRRARAGRRAGARRSSSRATRFAR